MKLKIFTTSDEKGFYVISYDEDAKKDALKKVDIENDYSTESLIYFLRDVDSYELSVSFDERYVAVLDSTIKPETVYIVDLQEESRTNVFEGYVLRKGKWAKDGSVFVFSGKDVDGNSESLWYWDSGSEEVMVLPFEADMMNFDFGSNGKIYFISDKPYRLKAYGNTYLLEFEETEEIFDYGLLFEEPATPDSLILSKMDISNDKLILVQDLIEIMDRIPGKIEVSEDMKLVRILINNKLFDIRLTE
jgi:hypothetical protein